MNRFRNWLLRFMSGRYGTDALGKFTVILYLILVVLQMFLLRTPFMLGIGSWIYNSVLLLLLSWSVFRMFSRNISARSAENRRFLSIKNGVKKFFYLRKRMWKDRKTHVYKKCPHCKCVLRLPKRKGDHSVNCPKCGKAFRVKISRGA